MSEVKNYTPTSGKCEWHITLSCNLACVNCNRLSFLNNHPIPDMTLDDAIEFLRQCKELNWRPDIIIIGGEPTLHAQFLNFCELAREFVGYHGLVQVWSNASAPNSREILNTGKRLHNISVPVETHKEKSQVLRIDDIFVSPKDFGIERHECYAHSNTICGISVDSGGYSLCSQAGPIDQILKLGIRTKKLADLFDNEWAAKTTKTMCENCGNALSTILGGDELKEWRKNVEGCHKRYGSRMSPTWLKATEGMK